LLITDDPDDHNAISEAIAKISENIVVVIIINSKNAGTVLSSKAHVPDFLIIDLSMDGLDINAWLLRIRGDGVLSRIPILTYGDPSEYADIFNRQGLTFFAKEYEFSKLQSVLKDFIDDRFN
jgi:DNA-binding NtrC family response regulator